MLIGSLFTLAGYFLASVINTQSPNAHAQDNTTKVFDKIVCKELEVVNDNGKTVAKMRNFAGGGHLGIYNPAGHKVASLSGELAGGILKINGLLSKGEVLLHSEGLSFWDKEGKKNVGLHPIAPGGNLVFYNKDGKESVRLGDALGLGGALVLYNKDSKPVVTLNGSLEGSLHLLNSNGTDRVYIGAIKDRPNDGLINIYDYKGDHRSYTAD